MCVFVCLCVAVEGIKISIGMKRAQGHNLMHPKCLQLCVSVCVCACFSLCDGTCVHVNIHISVCVHAHVSSVCKSQLLNDNVCDNSVVLINL